MPGRREAPNGRSPSIRACLAHGVLGRIAQDYRWDYAAADRHFQRAIELSPGSEAWYRQRARLLSVLGRHDEAIALAPNQPYGLAYTARALSARGRHAESIAAADRALQLAPGDPIVVAAAGAVHATAGDSVEARRPLAALLAFPRPSPFLAAEVLAQLGDGERMFGLLDRAVAERDPLLSEIGAVPVFDPFREDPRMKRLFGRIGLELKPAAER